MGERHGGAGAGGQVEEQVELEEEGEGGELHQQWDRHQDAAEALRRWKKWQGVCETLADCCGAVSCCSLRNTPRPSPAGKCRGVTAEGASRAFGEQIRRNGNLWSLWVSYGRLCCLQHHRHPRFCCLWLEEPPEERATNQNWRMCHQLSKIKRPAGTTLDMKSTILFFWNLWQ